MAKRGGFPGGLPGNMNNLMKQAQRMQRQMCIRDRIIHISRHSSRKSTSLSHFYFLPF